MDIGKLATVEKHEEGVEFRLLDSATGEELDAVFIVQGLDSKAWRSALKESRKKNISSDEFDLFDHENLWPMVAKVIIGWRELEKDGEDFEFTPENTEWLCENSPNVVNQIFSFLIDRENFTKD